jgi:hypothetical protein
VEALWKRLKGSHSVSLAASIRRVALPHQVPTGRNPAMLLGGRPLLTYQLCLNALMERVKLGFAGTNIEQLMHLRASRLVFDQQIGGEGGTLCKLMYFGAWTYPPRDLADMLMMGEIDHLAYLGHFGEEPECLLGAKIVEGLHDVVGDKRHRTA